MWSEADPRGLRTLRCRHRECRKCDGVASSALRLDEGQGPADRALGDDAGGRCR